MYFKQMMGEEWRKEAVGLWPYNTDYHWITYYDNAHLNLMQYRGREVFDKTMLFFIGGYVNNELVSFCHCHNISDTVIRFRGVYVKPKFRGNKFAPMTYDYGLSLWPKPWNKAIIFYRDDTLSVFKKYWDVECFEDYDWRHRQIPDERVIMTYKRFNDE